MENSRNKQFLSFKLCAVLSNMMKFCAVLLCPAQEPQPSTSSSPVIQGHSHDWMIQGHLEQMTRLLLYCQKVSNSLMLCHNAYVIPLSSSHHARRHFIISCHHKKKGNYSTIRYFERERYHIHITFNTVYCSILLFIVVNLFLCLIHKINLS